MPTQPGAWATPAGIKKPEGEEKEEKAGLGDSRVSYALTSGQTG